MTVDAIRGTYANFRLIKSRGVCVIEVEVPVEASKHALDILGGMPVFGQDTWVAIARLRDTVEPDPAPQAIEAPEKAKQPLRASAMAALMCKEPAFWKWADEKFGDKVANEEEAIVWLRDCFGISSRKEFDSRPNVEAAFHEFRDEYLAWKQVG